MMDGGLDHGAVHPQLAPSRHLQLAGQGHHVVEQGVERRRADERRPPQECRVVRRRRQPQAAELAQDQAVGDEVLRLGVAPAVQPAHDEQPEEHLHRRGGAPGHQRLGPAPGQVGLDRLEEPVVVEQGVQARQHGLKRQGQVRHEREQIDSRIAVA